MKHCWTRLMALNLHISRPGCTAGARSGGHLKDRHCRQVKDSACTPSCFRFSTKRNLISLPQFIMSPHVCGEISHSVDSNKVYKDPADFKRLSAQCGFLTERSNQGCVGRADISCVVHVQESHSSDAEVLTQQGSERSCYNSGRLNILQEAWKVTRRKLHEPLHAYYAENGSRVAAWRWIIAHFMEFWKKINEWIKILGEGIFF